MSDEIKIDFDEFGQIADQFSSQAESIAEMHQKIMKSFEKLNDKGWIGEGAEAFFSEMFSDVLPAQLRLSSALEDASRTSHDIMNVVKEAEQDASSLFR
jgi:WXG100 family type VII secretion target